MTNQPADSASAIKDNGWRQGAVLPRELVDELRERRDIPSTLVPADKAIGVVVSQDCDVVHACFETEPYVEVLWGTLVESGIPNNGLRWCRSFRKLQLLLTDAENQGREAVLEVSIHDRTRIGRQLLCEFSPSTSFAVKGDELLEMRLWITLRYTRPAFPDAFNHRIAPRQKEIRSLLTGEAAAHLSGLFLLLLPLDKELPPGEKYELVIMGVMRTTDYKDENKREAAVALIDDLAARLAACEDLDVKDSIYNSEKGMNLANLRVMKRWCAFDHLTLRDSSVRDIATDV